MIIIISGQPGNGKTLRALALAREEYERNKAANALPATSPKWEEKRRFFSNIEGASLEDNPNAFPWLEKMPEHRDWRQLPDGSFVIYDEAHSDGKTAGLEHYGKLFPGTGKPGESDDPRVRAMSTSRHRGFDLVMVTQWPSKIHHNIRQLAGRHIHMNRAMGMQRAGVLSWTRVQADPYDERQREKAEEEIWTFEKDLYTRYASATLHSSTHKFRMPKKVWGVLSMALAIPLVGWGLWTFVFSPDNLEGAAKPEAAPLARAPAGAGGARPADPGRNEDMTAMDIVERFTPRIPVMPWTAPAWDGREVVSDPVAVCALFGAGLDANDEHQPERCLCLTEQGTRYELADKQCRAIVAAGGVYNPYKSPAGTNRYGSEPGLVSRGAGVSPAVTFPGVSGSGISGAR